MVRGAIEPAVPGTSDDAHPALKVPFGKMQSQHPSEQERQALKCAVANTLDYCNRTACGAFNLCAQCRRVLSLDTFCVVLYDQVGKLLNCLLVKSASPYK